MFFICCYTIAKSHIKRYVEVEKKSCEKNERKENERSLFYSLISSKLIKFWNVAIMSLIKLQEGCNCRELVKSLKTL